MRDAPRKDTGVEPGLADQGEHVPVCWVDGDCGAAMIRQGLLRSSLSGEIDRQYDIVACNGCDCLQVRSIGALSLH